ncbi:hypothetical protein Rhe02_52890 [Rhizocola hellebori]|uniref:Uncharacterized protein n=1 Tax=Rhizocola hellebori TaxID=1392758 RepID=A0A8J3QCN9_9ACTN|nr:hypothetical protein Rhe02_52890 [Rhizocola hellebori]
MLSSGLAFSTRDGLVFTDIDGRPPLPWLKLARLVTFVQQGWAMVNVAELAE